MKLKICLIIGIILIYFCTYMYANQNSYSSKVKLLIEYAQKLDAAKSINLYKSLNDKEKKEFARYLEKNPAKLSPIYFVIIADDVYKTDKDKAVFFYNFGKIRAIEDVRMCKDTTARNQTAMYGLFAPEVIKYMQSKAKDVKYTTGIFNKIIEWDNKYTDRISPVWSCYHGIQVFINKGEPELLPESDFEKIKKEMHETLKAAPQELAKAGNN